MKGLSKYIGWLMLAIGVLAVGTFIKNKTQDDLPVESMEQAAPVDTMVKEEVMVEDKMMDQDEAMMESSHLQVELELSNYQFSQKTLTVEAGQKVTIKLKNIDGFHDFVIDELKVASKQISADQEDSVTFTVPESEKGKSFEYYCSVGSHRELGMKGTLLVK
jgi:plastocyanin